MLSLKKMPIRYKGSPSGNETSLTPIQFNKLISEMRESSFVYTEDLTGIKHDLREAMMKALPDNVKQYLENPQKVMSNLMLIKVNDEMGLTLVTTGTIPKNTVIGIYAGKVSIAHNDDAKLNLDPVTDLQYVMDCGQYWVDAEKTGGLMSFMNCYPDRDGEVLGDLSFATDADRKTVYADAARANVEMCFTDAVQGFKLCYFVTNCDIAAPHGGCAGLGYLYNRNHFSKAMRHFFSVKNPTTTFNITYYPRQVRVNVGYVNMVELFTTIFVDAVIRPETNGVAATFKAQWKRSPVCSRLKRSQFALIAEHALSALDEKEELQSNLRYFGFKYLKDQGGLDLFHDYLTSNKTTADLNDGLIELNDSVRSCCNLSLSSNRLLCLASVIILIVAIGINFAFANDENTIMNSRDFTGGMR